MLILLIGIIYMMSYSPCPKLPTKELAAKPPQKPLGSVTA